MHDLDQIRSEREAKDRTVRLGGQDLVFRAYVWADSLVKLQDAASDQEFLAIADDVIPAHLLEPGQQDKWALVRSPENPKPVGMRDIVDLVNYVQGAVSGRPFEQPSGSSHSPAANGTGSTESSPVPVPTSAHSTSGGY